MHIQDTEDATGNPGAQWQRKFLDTKTPNYKADISDRLYYLEKRIKNKFSQLWVSVRKAFLDLDHNKDGLIEATDILRYFGDHDEIDLVDLKALIEQKVDNTKTVTSRKTALNCHDFTNWLGEAIH